MKRIIRATLLLLALLAMGYGLFRGEGATVFEKAANICLECIGFG